MQQQHQQHQQQMSYGNGRTTTTTPSSGATTSDSISPKYMSQSTIDLKKTHILSGNSNGSDNGACRMQPAESENNLATDMAAAARLSPFAVRSEFIGRKLSLDEQQTAVVAPMMANGSGGGGAHRSVTPVKKEGKPTIRKDSLKENIDKITQLQSKLMSGGERSASNLVRDSSFRNSLSKLDGKPPPLPPSTPPVLMTSSSDKHATIATPPPPTTPPVDQCTVAVINEETNQSSGASPLVIVAELSADAVLRSGGSATTTPTKMGASPSPPVDGSSPTKLLQRTEIVLRLNAPTAEAASQTDDNDTDGSCASVFTAIAVPAIADESPLNGADGTELSVSPDRCIGAPTPIVNRARHSIDVDCENLSKDLVSQLSPSDRLHHILGEL